MSNKKKLALVFGGNSDEYEVSLQSAYAILEAMDTSKYDIFKIAISKQNKFYLIQADNEVIVKDTWLQHKHEEIYFRKEKGFYDKATNTFQELDVVFPMIHGAVGEDGTLAALFKLCEIPYCSCPPHSLMVGFDKELSHLLANSIDIKTPNAKTLYQHFTNQQRDEVLSSLSYPCYVKPARNGSSIGISHVLEKGELDKAIKEAFHYDSKLVIEEEIRGIEVGVAILGNTTLHISEPDAIDNHNQFFDYSTKYHTHSQTSYQVAPLPCEIKEQIKYYASQLYKAFECQVYARIDFFVDENKQIYFNEINMIPGFTNTSRFPQMMLHYGFTYSTLIDQVISYAHL